MNDDEGVWLWRHFALNAEQRLKAFNFFVVLSVFADGGVFAVVERSGNWVVLLLLGGFISLLAFAFFLIDLRSRRLILLAVPGLTRYESRFADESRVFALDNARKRHVVSYTFAIRLLLGAQFAFGIGVIGFALLRATCRV